MVFLPFALQKKRPKAKDRDKDFDFSKTILAFKNLKIIWKYNKSLNKKYVFFLRMMLFKTINLFDHAQENSTFCAINISFKANSFFVAVFILSPNILKLWKMWWLVTLLKLILILSFGTCFAICWCSALIYVFSNQVDWNNGYPSSPKIFANKN